MSSFSVYHEFLKTAGLYPKRDFLYLVEDSAARYKEKPGAVTYADALIEITKLIKIYSSLDLTVGNRVALALDNRNVFFYHWLAFNALGVSVIPLNPQWRRTELEYVFEHSEVKMVVCLEDKVALLEEVRKGLSDEVKLYTHTEISGLQLDGEKVDLDSSVIDQTQLECALLYTSGTTGKPKGCVLSNEYFLLSGVWYKEIGGYCALKEEGDRLITPLPMYHMNAMATSTMAMIMTGGCIIPLDRFHPRSFWQSVMESDATILHYLGVMPVMLMGLESVQIESKHKLRFGFGAGLSGELHAQFEERFNFKLIEAWAMTETGCAVAIIASSEPRKVGTACFGRAGPNIDYRLVDEHGVDVAKGVPGELLIRSRGDNPKRGFFSSYLKNDRATAEVWQTGYFNTGDLVREDNDGSLHFEDRKKNIIRRSGENISAVEVEETLIQHPCIRTVGVAAVKDEVRGDEVFACITTDSKEEDWVSIAEDIVKYCLKHLAYYKAPGYIGICKQLPRTATEKIQRSSLKDLAEGLLRDNNCIDTRHLKKSGG